MAFYLVRAWPNHDRLAELDRRVAERAFLGLRPFGRALSGSLEAARVQPDGRAVWEEEDYCVPPLAQEREAVLDRYFDGIEVEPVARDEGWGRIKALPRLLTSEVESEVEDG
jgi:hypothetical protein